MSNDATSAAGVCDESHPSDELLLQFAEGAVAAAHATAIAAHLRTCARCASITSEIARARAILQAALLRLDASEPPSWQAFATVAAPARASRATAERRSLLHAPPTLSVTVRRVRRMSTRVAAAVTLIAGVSYAAVYLRGRLSVTGPQSVPMSHAAPRHATTTIQQPTPSADFVVRIDSAAGDSRVVIDVVNVGDAVRVEVRGARDPHFESTNDALNVGLRRERATIHVTVPPRVTSLRVIANGREVARVNEGRVAPVMAERQGVVLLWY